MAEQEEFDLDEDLFHFEDTLAEEAYVAEDDESLEAIFATFQSAEDAASAQRALEAQAEDEFVPFDTAESEAIDVVAEVVSEEVTPVAAEPILAAPSEPVSAPGPVAPSAVPAAKQGRFASAISKSVLLILVSVTLLNGMIGFVVLRQSSSIMDQVTSAGSSLLDTADEIKRSTLENTLSRIQMGAPLPVWDVENNHTFKLAKENIEAGEFKAARKKLNTFLAMIDGIEPGARDDMEARAKMLIASSIQLEAIAMDMEDDQ